MKRFVVAGLGFANRTYCKPSSIHQQRTTVRSGVAGSSSRAVLMTSIGLSCWVIADSSVVQAIKNPARGGAFCLFSSIKRRSSFDEISNGGATNDSRDAVDRAKRSKANGNVDNVFPEAAALHGLQIVFVDGLSVESLSGHELEVS